MLNFKINKSSTIEESLTKININKKGFLIVVDDLERVAGVVTDGDIRRLLLKGYKLSDVILFSENFQYLDEGDTFAKICNLFNDSNVSFLPICNSKMTLVNLITKKQFHLLLLHNKEWGLNYDFLSLEEGDIEHDANNKPWGFYKSTILSKRFQSKIITVFPGGELSLQEHQKREEHWVIVSGEGKVVLGASTLDAFPGKYVYIPKRVKHRIINNGSKNLVFIEIQLGSYFGEDDIIRHLDKYDRER